MKNSIYTIVRALLFGLFMLPLLSTAIATNIYVDSTATGNANGTSWIDADTTLQDALTSAASGDTIFVAQGTYYPDEGGGQTNNNRNATFTIPSGVVILGGFPSGGSSIANRDVFLYSTTLSGDIDQVAGPANNSIHVIMTAAVTSATTLDGFYVVDGNSTSNFGGGWLNTGSPTVRNCVFMNNQASSGGAMYNNGFASGNSSPTYINCRFDNNSSFNTGGAIVNYGEFTLSSPVLINCVFTNNVSNYGGALNNDGFYGGVSSPDLINCTFFNNSANINGSVLANTGLFGMSTPTMKNCILWNNGSNVIWQDDASTTVNYSVFEGSFPFAVSGANNIFSDPLFADSTDLQLTICSPAINTANNAYIPAGITTDILGNDRIFQSTVDMGAYEFQTTIGGPKNYYVDSTVQQGDGLSWSTAFNKLQDALTLSCLAAGDSIFVATGTYYPDEGFGQINDDRSSSFNIPSGVVVLGAFPSGGGDLSSRDYTLNETILSGDIVQDIFLGQNALHVVKTFNVSDTTVVDGFIIQDGLANGNSKIGAGWYNTAKNIGTEVSRPTISNCTFFRNIADSLGGAIYNLADSAEASPIITHCTFIDNTANKGGAVYNDWYAVHIQPIITDCIFDNNQATYGGGIYNGGSSDSSTLIVRQSIFKNNYAFEKGGAIYTDHRSSLNTSKTTNCLFIGNVANQGGAIYYIGFQASQPESRTPNDKPESFITNCTFTDNGSQGSFFDRTHVLHNDGESIVYLNNNIIWNNGQSAHIMRSVDTIFADRNIYEGDFPSEVITDGFTNIYENPLFLSDSNVHLQPCSPAIDFGLNSYLAVDDTLDLDGNARVYNSTVDAGVFEYSLPFVNRSVFYVDSSVVAGDGTSWPLAYASLQDVFKTQCPDAGDTIFIAQGSYYPDEGQLTVDDDRNATFHIPSDVVILGGFPTGGSSMSGRNYELYKSTLSGNIDQSSSSSNNSNHVVTTTNASAATIIDGLYITGGNASSSEDGGGWFNLVEVEGNASSPTIRNCTFYDNYADGDGGAVYNGAEEGDASPTFVNCTFTNNSARSGGAVYNEAEYGFVNSIYTDCSFNMNTSQREGGAICNYADDLDCSPSFIRCTFNSNSTAEGKGGAMYNEASDGNCSPIITACQFLNNETNTDNNNNSGDHGGAIYNEAYEADCAPIIYHSIFSGNKANDADGGAIYNYGAYEEALCAPTIMFCQFDSNQADRGGAIHNYAEDGPCEVEIVNSIFLDNNANDEGGAIFNYGENNECLVNIKSSSFSNNYSDYGYAIYNDADEEDYCILNLSNSIVWHYDEDQDNIENSGDARMIAVRNIYQGEYPDETDSMGVTSIHINPAFFSPEDLRLLPCSPAIDEGINDSIPVGLMMDLDSNIRIYNGTVDIGAYEFQSIFEDPTKIYVDASSTGGNGFSWSTAFNYLQDALISGCLQDGDTIFVAAGTYYPDEGLYQEDDDEYASFNIPSGVTLLGGFPIGGGLITSRDYLLNETILSGNIDQSNDAVNNTVNIIRTTNASPSTRIDGFYIEDGNGNHGGSQGGAIYNRTSGDGILSSPTIANTVFRNNIAEEGGAIYNRSSSGDESSPTIINCTFINNSAFSGGAIAFYGSGKCNAVVQNCKFSGNNASTSGGAIANNIQGPDTCATSIINCVFVENSATQSGGAIWNVSSSGVCIPSYINCSISNNSAPIAGAIYNSSLTGSCDVNISNSILWENGANALQNNTATSRLSHSIYQGSIPAGTTDVGTTNLNLDPIFVSPTDLRIALCSPANNAGSNDSIPSTITTDILGNNRVFNVDVDMGAYELQSAFVGDMTTLYVDSSSASGLGESWAQAYNYLQDALSSPCLDAGDTIAIAQGTYYPDDGADQINNDRSMTFNIPSGIVVLGGFPTGGSSLSNRIYSFYKTVLSGDIDQNDSLKLNSYHVVSTTNVSDSTRIDGLYVRDGNASISTEYGGGWYNLADGAGMSSKPVISNCIFEYNSADRGGGGLANYSLDNGECSPELINCTFQNNNSNIWGGAVSNRIAFGSCYAKFTRCKFRLNQAGSGGAVYNAGNPQMSPAYLHCLFEGNSAASNSIGGAVYSSGGISGNSTLLFGNCVFKGNLAGRGAALYNSAFHSNKTVNIINCSFAGNHANINGGAIANGGDTSALEVIITNSIIWGNSVPAVAVGNPNLCKISHSVLQEVPDSRIALSGYISYNDPLFEDEPDFNTAPAIGGDLDILYGSSALNQGLNSFLPPDITVDFGGDDRIINNVVDIGAYEFDYRFPCFGYTTLTIDEIPIYNGTYRATGLISSTGEVNSNSMGPVIYRSETSIELNSGFEVKLGEEFEAIIGNLCPGP